VKRLVNRDHFACHELHVAEKPQPLLPPCVERDVTLETPKSVMLGLAFPRFGILAGFLEEQNNVVTYLEIVRVNRLCNDDS
jgi:hypothetical protein